MIILVSNMGSSKHAVSVPHSLSNIVSPDNMQLR